MSGEIRMFSAKLPCSQSTALPVQLFKGSSTKTASYARLPALPIQVCFSGCQGVSFMFSESTLWFSSKKKLYKTSNSSFQRSAACV